MKVLILLTGLSILYLRDPIWRRREVSATDAFTGVWLVAVLALFFNPAAWQFLTWRGVGCILATHLIFAFGIILVSLISIRSTNKIASMISTCQSYRAHSSELLFYSLLPVSIFGVIGTFISAGGFSPLLSGSIAETRSNLLGGELRIPLLYRICANFMYPSLLLGAFNATRVAGWRHWPRFIAMPLLCPILYSLSMGGKGCLIISTSIVIWTFFLTKGVRAALRSFLLLLGGVLLFAAFITSTRPDSEGAFATLNIYIYGPLVALSQYLEEHSAVEWYNTSFEHFSIVREVGNALGASYSRSIDQTVVNIPAPYNVFTCVPEWLEAFGLFGSMFLVFSIAFATGLIDNRSHSRYVMLRAVIYVYLGFSLFSDISFLMFGWWICLLIALLSVFPSKLSVT